MIKSIIKNYFPTHQAADIVLLEGEHYNYYFLVLARSEKNGYTLLNLENGRTLVWAINTLDGARNVWRVA